MAIRCHLTANRRKYFPGVWCGVALAAALYGSAPAQEPFDPAPTEAEVAQATASVLADAQLLKQPLDDKLSARFLNGYLDALDASHLTFLQSDVDEFGWFQPDLAPMMLAEGDTWPGHLIFTRYLSRLARQVNFQTNFLQTARFDFTGHDSWQLNRQDLIRPRDLNAAQALWQEEVRADYLQEKLAGRSPSDIVRRLTRRYERRFQITHSLSSDEVLEIYLDAFGHSFDPHSDYFGHDEKQEFTSQLNLSLAGIGGSLEARGGHWVIGDLVPGGPAARSGRLHPGDRILGVARDGGEPEEVTDLPSWRVAGLIRGPKGSTVRLTVIPAGQGDAAAKTVSLVREDVKLTQGYARASIIDWPTGRKGSCRLGVIMLPLFYQGSGTNGGGASADTARLIRRLKQEGVAGLILDLRRNPGGSLEEAIKLTGLFIPAGPVVQTRDSTGHVKVEQSSEPKPLYDGPLVVLTSRFSASSSEVVAGALQDYGRALIVGDSTTYGKGTLQTLVPLKQFFHYSGLGAVKVTIAEFYRPSGVSAQLKGIASDLVLPSETDLPNIGEAQMPDALPPDTVPEAAYAKFDQVGPVLAALREKSTARVASKPWFRLVRDKMAALSAECGRSLSLNESARRQENAVAGQLQNKLNKIQLVKSARARRIYDLTLADEAAAASAEESGPAEDMELSETENILADYIQLRRAASPESTSFAQDRRDGMIVGKRGWAGGKEPGELPLPLDGSF